MDCYSITVTGITKDGYECFTHNVQLLREMPYFIVTALRLAAEEASTGKDALNYEALSNLFESLFEAGN